jgi:hypothetical protein
MAINKRLIKSNDEGGGEPSFNTVLYTGNNTANRQITDVGFQPDLVWIKGRTITSSHVLSDSLRGANLKLRSNSTAAEAGTDYGVVSAFSATGFSVDGTIDKGDVNNTGDNYVAWCWKAGGAAVSAASVEATGATRSANPAAGFSIIKFTSSNSTASPEPPMNYIEHGLDSTPKMVIYKPTNVSGAWRVMHVDNGQKWIELQSTAAAAGPFTYTIWDNTPTSIGVRSNYAIGRGNTHIAYCFAEVAGFSKFGSYNGTGNVGNKQTLGFEPAFVLIKDFTAVNQWYIYDKVRQPTNPNGRALFPNLSDAEVNFVSPNQDRSINLLSDGFDFNAVNSSINGSGRTYIYMAFANQF